MVSPRKSRKKSLFFSKTRTSTPARARRNPSMTPAGPPPTMQQPVRMVSSGGVLRSFMVKLSLWGERTGTQMEIALGERNLDFVFAKFPFESEIKIAAETLG